MVFGQGRLLLSKSFTGKMQKGEGETRWFADSVSPFEGLGAPAVLRPISPAFSSLIIQPWGKFVNGVGIFSDGFTSLEINRVSNKNISL